MLSAADPTGVTIASLLATREADPRPGLVVGTQTFAWADVVAQARLRARLLWRSRRPGPFHVGVLLDNVPEYVFLLFGAALCGGTVVGINSTRRGAHLESDITHTDCQMVISDTSGVALTDGLDLGVDPDAVLDVESARYREMLDAADGSSEPGWGTPRPDDPYLLLFTAGSTGTPKAVRMSQGRAAATAAESARAFGPDDVLYCAMPLFHGNALVANLFPALTAGASVVLRRRFSASAFGADIRRYGCTYFNYVGRALSYIVGVDETPEDGDNRLKWALGSEASPQNITEFSRRYRCPVFEGYGSSENAVVISPAPGSPKGSLGRARPGMDVAILDAGTGRECAPAVFDGDGRLLNPTEAIGEIVGRNTASRFEGYYNNPGAEAERTRDGLYWTGDLGYRDADSWFYFAGRSAEWLRVDGENFSAGAVERILNRLPRSSGVAVYAVPDPVSGDQVMAALEMPSSDGFDPSGFAKFLSEQPDLGTKWTPRFVRIVERLPATGAGKVDKHPLRSQAWNTTDAVWWRDGGAARGVGGLYRRFTEPDATALRAAFDANGRGGWWPERSATGGAAPRAAE